MTPEERRLIEDLFDRMGRYGTPDKDREAEGLINQRLRALPDAAYMLTQSVLVQEEALEAANQRVLELEDRLRELEAGGDAPPRGAGGFLGGGAFNERWRNEDARPSSVPQVGARATPSTYQRPQASSAAPPAAASAAGGGFMRSAMATAAGVAGGVLVAESIRNMMGSHAKAAETKPAEASAADQSTPAAQDTSASAYDRGDYDTTSYDDAIGGDGDFGDDSIDI
jgi:hypothetical protein